MARVGLEPAPSFEVAGSLARRAVFAASTRSNHYFIKVYREPEILKEELNNLTIASAAKIPVPQIVGFEHMDAIAVLVLTKVRGRHISPQDRGVWRELGAIVAQVSAIEPPRGSWGRRWPELVIKRTCEELEQWVALYLIGREDEAALIDRIRGLEPILALRPLSVDTHNDLQADHVLIDPATGKVQDLLG